MKQVCMQALPFPEIHPGDPLPQIILSVLREQQLALQDGDILAVAHKVVSKAEGRLCSLETVIPSDRAEHYARLTGKDPRVLQLAMEESTHLLHYGMNRPFVCRHRLGYVCANAGVDCSNTGNADTAVLLPVDPDASAREIVQAAETEWGVQIGVLICDTHGRPFREGSCGIAVGLSGISGLKSYIGEIDRDGRQMQSSVEGVGDELAAAATLLMGQGSEGHPLVLLRGLGELLGKGDSSQMIRKPERDLFLQASLEEKL